MPAVSAWHFHGTGRGPSDTAGANWIQNTSDAMIDDVYQAALAAVRHHLDQAGAGYRMDDGEIVVGGHRLGLSIGFDGFAQQGELVLAPLDVQIHLDGDTGDRFRVGTLGVGPDREAAIRDAVSEWHLLAAAPLLAALGAAVEKRRAPTQPQKLNGWELFAGRVGIRGAVPPSLRAGGSVLPVADRALAAGGCRLGPARSLSIAVDFYLGDARTRPKRNPGRGRRHGR